LSDPYIHRTAEDFARLMPEGQSGNSVNGLGDPVPGRPRPFFWHPPEQQAFGELQRAVIDHHRQSPAIAAAYSRDADRGPRPLPRAAVRDPRSPAAWTDALKTFALAHEADLVGITPLRPEYVYEGYELTMPWLVMIGVAMDHDNLAAAPATIDDVRAGVEVAEKYNRAARACRHVANHILAAGYEAKTFPGPMATALNMIPAAIAAGLGELGKHGSMINRRFGSSFRLSAVATDLPLLADAPDDFGADEFCTRCRVCTQACPPQAIFEAKQMVRGHVKWYVDFDRCIPYFGETFACGICLAVCPFSRPGVGPRLVDKLARRRERKATSAEPD
jgi:ferredoxin